MLSHRQSRLPQLAKLLVGFGVMAGGLGAWLLFQPVALGQTAQPRITSISIPTLGVNNVSIAVTFSEDVESRVLWGTTTRYGNYYPPSQAFIGAQRQFTFQLAPPDAPLEASTTYHFVVEIRRDESSPTTASADRSFTTRSGTSGNLIPRNIVADCIDTRCRISYSTGVETNIQLRWDNTDHPAFMDYTGGAAAEPGGQYRANTRTLEAINLTANTTYHYMLQSTDSGGSVATTSDLVMVTSANADDHVFTTGGCADGTPIGQCSTATPGAFCAEGGGLEQSCGNACGFSCPANQSCNSAQQCVADPRLTGSPYQCNPPTCYDNGGRFIVPSPAGSTCYGSWPKCSANTILKVRKDRACNLWLTCGTSIQLPPSANESTENLCLSLAGCNSLSRNGQCNKYLPHGQCDNDPLRFCSVDADCAAGGACNNPPSEDPTRSLQNLTFLAPEDVGNIANLSGNVVAGLDWGRFGGSNVISGFLPWQLMRQIGGNATIDNANIEDSAVKVDPWEPVPTTIADDIEAVLSVEFEDKSSSSNRVLRVEPKPVVENVRGDGACSNQPGILCDDDADCNIPPSPPSPPLPVGTCSVIDGTCSQGSGACTRETERSATPVCTRAGETCEYPDITINFSGAATKVFTTTPGEYYTGEVRVRALDGETPALRVQFGHSGYRLFSAEGNPTFVDIKATSAWQRVVVGPLRGMNGETRLAVVCADTANCGRFEIDDAQVKPVLQVSTDPAYVTPSCRLYPKEDSPACDYTDANGVNYKGWRGYCLEHDSVTGTCLSWWPVDIIKGESGIFGNDIQAGYDDQVPLYYCAEAEGLNQPDPLTSFTTFEDFGADGLVENSQANLRSPLVGQPLYNIRVMTTRINDPDIDQYNDDADQCGDVWNRGFCRNNPPNQRGICACPDHIWDPGPIPASAEDEAIHEYEVDYFIVWPQRLTQGDFPGGPTVIHRTSETETCNCWRGEAQSADGQERWTLQLNWDRDDKRLVSYDFFIIDGHGDQGGLWAAGMFAMRAGCNKVVQVVDPSGRNQAFAARVKSTSYNVPDISYERPQDQAPYGALVPPVDSDTPENWPRLAVEKPNFSNFEGTAQARAGSPYACVGDCNRSVCNIDPWGIYASHDCSTQTGADACQNGFDWANISNADLNGDGVSDGQCIGINAPSISNKGAQLFDPTIDPSAIPGTTAGCYEDPNNPLECNQTGAVGRIYLGFPGDPDTDLGNTCRNRIACDGRNNACTAGPIVGTAVNYSGVTDVSCRDLGGGKTGCTGTCVVNTGTTFRQVYSGVSNAYYAQQHIRRLFASSIRAWEWRGLSYQSFTGQWFGPEKVCPDSDPEIPDVPLRPPFPQDFCAMPPGIADDPLDNNDGPQFLSGTARSVTLTGGSGSVGIKFNTSADSDQLPLKMIRINWGDGADDYGYPFAPRTDPAKPHVFSHAYVINPSDTECRQSNGGCTYHIKIQVCDNWDWCNDYQRVNLGNDIPREENADLWRDTGLTVSVEP